MKYVPRGRWIQESVIVVAQSKAMVPRCSDGKIFIIGHSMITPMRAPTPTTMPATREIGLSRAPVSGSPSMAFLPMHIGGSDLRAIHTIGSNISNRAVIVWHGTKAKISRLLRHTSPDTRTTDEAACRLPPEIVEMIIAHLTDDLDTLKTCSLTCRSWYTAAVPYIHHTLFLGGKKPGPFRNNFWPLSKLHGRGLTPLVKEIRVRQRDARHRWFLPWAFNRRNLLYFSAFTNVQTLSIQRLDIHSFIPGIERYFEQFSQTLRSISLFLPICSTPQQLSHFLSLFPNLDDISISRFHLPIVFTPSRGLPPFSAPKLRGWLLLDDCHPIEPWTYMIAACGGLRFRHMELFWVESCAPILLEACDETLETLRFHIADGRSQ